MIRVLTILLLVSKLAFADISDISKINQIKKDAESAYKNGDFEKAAAKYSYLLDTLLIEDDNATMNLAHCYYQNDQKDIAQSQYAKLVLSKDEKLKSTAYQQLGAMSNDPKTLEKALSYFKESIRSNPQNEDSRYNYELVKKKLKEQQQQKQDQNQDKNDDDQDQDQEKENKDKENEDQQSKEQKDGDNKDQESKEQEDQENKDQEQKDQEQKEQEEKEKEKQEQEQQQKEGEEEEKEQKTPEQQTADKLKEMNISEEKAKMILEALKNNEIQYIQQNRRKATKRKDSDKPDW